VLVESEPQRQTEGGHGRVLRLYGKSGFTEQDVRMGDASTSGQNSAKAVQSQGDSVQADGKKFPCRQKLLLLTLEDGQKRIRSTSDQVYSGTCLCNTQVLVLLEKKYVTTTHLNYLTQKKEFEEFLRKYNGHRRFRF